MYQPSAGSFVHIDRNIFLDARDIRFKNKSKVVKVKSDGSIVAIPKNAIEAMRQTILKARAANSPPEKRIIFCDKQTPMATANPEFVDFVYFAYLIVNPLTPLARLNRAFDFTGSPEQDEMDDMLRQRPIHAIIGKHKSNITEAHLALISGNIH